MSKEKRLLKVVGFLLFSLFGLAARADLVIEITQGVRSALPIAVVPFGNQTGSNVTEDIARIIAENLQRTGDLNPLTRENMLSLPTRAEEVFFRDWSVLGQRYLVVGTVNRDPGSSVYKVRYELFDVQSQKRLLGKEVVGTEAQLRDIAHSISDIVYEMLTGIPGVFATRIAYVTLEGIGKGAQYKLEVADADGRRSRLIFRSPQPIISPAWAPSATKLAYVSFESGRPAIYIQDVESGLRTRVAAFPGINSAPGWSPDGNKLAMTLSKDGNPEIYVLDLRSSQLTRLTNHWAIDTEPTWSPDGNSIVFTSDRGGGPQVYQMKSGGGVPQRLTFEGKYNARPRYSLDGKAMYFVHQLGGNFHLAKLDLETSTTTILTETGMDESPSVAPNGSMVIYATRVQGKGILAVVGVNSGSKYSLPALSGDVREPAWSPYIKR
jgi:TolB protein